MENAWCGKDCAACALRAHLECPGCRKGPGASVADDPCPAASCCRRRRHWTCGQCPRSAGCRWWRQRDDQPRLRLERQGLAEARRAELLRAAPEMDALLRALFWTAILSMAGGLLTSALATGTGGSRMELAGEILQYLALAVRGGLLLALARRQAAYASAGWLQLAALAADAAATLVSRSWPPLAGAAALLPALILSILGEYRECRAHGLAAEPLQPLLTRRWRQLWYWTLGSAAAGAAVPFLALLALWMPLPGLLLLLAVAAVVVITALLRLVLLHRTAGAYRSFRLQHASERP